MSAAGEVPSLLLGVQLGGSTERVKRGVRTCGESASDSWVVQRVRIFLAPCVNFVVSQSQSDLDSYSVELPDRPMAEL